MVKTKLIREQQVWRAMIVYILKGKHAKDRFFFFFFTVLKFSNKKIKDNKLPLSLIQRVYDKFINKLHCCTRIKIQQRKVKYF